MFDLLIRNARVLDGTGGPWFRADVGVSGGRIAAVRRNLAGDAARTIEALWAAIGQIIAGFTPTECANYFAAAGYDPD